MVRRLVALTGAWGTRNGGINAFNTGLMKALGRVKGDGLEIVCPVQEAHESERKAVLAEHKVNLISTGLAMDDSGESALQTLERLLGNVAGSFNDTVWLGHDDKTGPVAIALRDRLGGKAILINHMNHGAYQGFKKGNSLAAHEKEAIQRELFTKADFCFAVGPRLKNELMQLLSTTHGAPEVAMLIPGLETPEDYGVKWLEKPPPYFGGFAAGRLGRDDDRIKQGRLAFRAFATTVENARKTSQIARLNKSPRMCLMGAEAGQESELRNAMQDWAGAQLQVKILPFSENRQEYFRELSGSSFAMMLSWHEGFGLTGWEALSARVPLILGRNSGLWEFLHEEMNGTGQETCLFPLDIDGNLPARDGEENHSEADVAKVASAIQTLAINADAAKAAAIRLHSAILAAGWTWDRAARDFLGQMDALSGNDVVRLDAAIPEKSSKALPSPVFDWIVYELAAELAKESCRSVANALLGPDFSGNVADPAHLRQALVAWTEREPGGVKRIEVLERAVKQALSPLSHTSDKRIALFRHGERLLGLMALTAVRPDALPGGADFGAELFKFGIKTLVGVELFEAATSQRTEVVFVWVGYNQKQIRSRRMLSVPSLESGWETKAAADEAVKEIVKSQVELQGDQIPTQEQIDEAAYVLTRKGAYFAVSPLSTPGHALLDTDTRAYIQAKFPNQPIFLFGSGDGRTANNVFNVSEGQLTGAIRTFMEMLDEYRKT